MVRLHPDLEGHEFNYEDIITPTLNIPDFSREDVDLSTYFTRDIKTKTCISSSPMDTVTNASLGILVSRHGGVPCIHFNFPKVYLQIEEALKIKNAQAGFVKRPKTLGPDDEVGDVHNIAREKGFYSIPITEDGTLNTPMVGLVTRRDIRFVDDTKTKLRYVMTPRYDKEGNEILITAHREYTMDINDIRVANKILRENNRDTLPIVDDDFKVVGLVTDSDLRKDEMYPLTTKDANKQPIVFIACEANLKKDDTKKRIYERIHSAYDAGLDGIILDQSIVFWDQFRITEYIKQNCPYLQTVLGNVCTGKQVETIIENAYKFTDAIKCNLGPGHACSSNENLRVGRASGSTVYECAEALKRLKPKSDGIRLIADGGVEGPGDIQIAILLGADNVMSGFIFAPYDESAAPSVKRTEVIDGKVREVWRKLYRGMASIEAMEERESLTAERYDIQDLEIKVPEGFTRYLEPAGSGYSKDGIPRLLAGIRQSFLKQGYKTIPEAQENGWVVPFPQPKK